MLKRMTAYWWDKDKNAVAISYKDNRLILTVDDAQALLRQRDILPRLMRGGGFLLKNPNGFSIDRLSPHALWFARCFTSRAARRFFWLRPGCSGRRSRPGRA